MSDRPPYVYDLHFNGGHADEEDVVRVYSAEPTAVRMLEKAEQRGIAGEIWLLLGTGVGQTLVNPRHIMLIEKVG